MDIASAAATGEDEYLKKTPKSQVLYDHAKSRFPGGISHNIRYFKPYPFFAAKAKGKMLHDVDGNVYTDYWMGHWALIIGHSHPIVSAAVKRQATNGTLFGTPNKISLDLADIIRDAMPKAELIRFSSTGSEATMYSVRLARAKTGRRVVAKIVGGWHGYNTNLLQSVNYPFELDEGMGLIEDEEQFVESIPFNDLDRSLKVLNTIKDDIACIIVEPILGGAGCITPQLDYLRGLQEFAKANNALFILDEVVTGFRLSYKGAAQEYGLDPDLFTLGKIVGGSLPIGVVCGDRDIMSLCNPAGKEKSGMVCYIGGGTFSANPLTMAAGLATLRYLKQNKSVVYPKINRIGVTIRENLTKTFSQAGIDVEITGTGSLFMTHFLNKSVRKIESALDVGLSDRETLRKYQFALIARHNIFFLPEKMGAISSVHTLQDAKNLVDATEDIIDSGVLSS
ncbi:MAG TPA: aminotransferase class III-fold pyridoxal phosphate-dependent enzyme [Nitrososphaeraceae archaeon]|nr:aminotransferase class III-fold pyridoxal phosphate-dependent enzyme [Nitrososphaeraceae archaeon]